MSGSATLVAGGEPGIGRAREAFHAGRTVASSGWISLPRAQAEGCYEQAFGALNHIERD